MLPALKLCCLVAGAISYYISFTPPNSPPTTEDKVNRGQLFDRIIRGLSLVTKTAVIIAFTSEFLVDVAVAFPDVLPDTILPALCRSTPDPHSLLSISRTFAIGLALMLLGVCLRLWCYKALGTLFTFEVTVRPSHKLIVTGPYSYVRHPSYTGSYAEIVGVVLLHFSPGGWNRQCHIMSTLGGWAVLTYLGLAAFACISFGKRSNTEDEMLREKFGSEWQRYRADVKWRFFPGVY